MWKRGGICGAYIPTLNSVYTGVVSKFYGYKSFEEENAKGTFMDPVTSCFWHNFL